MIDKKMILFDIDGTLLLSGGAGALAFDRVFEKLYQLDRAWQGIHPDGKTDPKIIDELFIKHFGRKASPQEHKVIEKHYVEEMAKSLYEVERFRLMEGAKTLVEELVKRKIAYLGLATGNYESTSYLKLERAGLKEYFAFGGFGSDSADRPTLTRRAFQRGMDHIGSRIKTEDVFVVGDTVHDVQSGKMIGAMTVAVATGSTPYETLMAARPDFCVHSFADLEESLNIFI